MKKPEYTRIGDTVYKNTDILFTNSRLTEAKENGAAIRDAFNEKWADGALFEEFKKETISKANEVAENKQSYTNSFIRGFQTASMEAIKKLEKLLLERNGLL